MRTTCRCGATWAGMRIEHCPACHETFTGTRAGDKHRTGDHAVFVGPERRRCLSPAEMTERGMVRNDRGVWTLGGVNPWAGVDAGTPNGSGSVSGSTEDANGPQSNAQRFEGNA